MANARAGSRRGSSRLTAILVGLVVLSSACASIPTSSPPRLGRDVRLDTEGSSARRIGEPPVPGANQENLVRGFLHANADFLDDHAVARQFLDRSVQQDWRPGAGTTVYDPAAGPFTVRRTGATTVDVAATEVARIDATGHYHRSAPGTRLHRTFQLTKVGTQWRIHKLSGGLVLTTSDVELAFRQVNLYFLAESGRTLVPDPVLLPDLPGLSTNLVTSLLHGPVEPLRAAASTAFPTGTDLRVASVPIRDGSAVVDLTSEVRRADDEERQQLSAQLVWTLRQLPGVQTIRVLAEGEDLNVSGAAGAQHRGAWDQFDPSPLPKDSNAYVVRAGRLGRVIDEAFVPLGGVTAETPAVRHPAVSLDTTTLAAISADHRVLEVAQLANAGTVKGSLTPLLQGTNLSAPSWDANGNVWVVDRPAGRVLVVPRGDSRAVQVSVAGPPTGRISLVRVSRDGTRVAVIAGSGRSASVLVGVVARDDQGVPVRIEGLTRFYPGLAGVRDVAWADPTTLAVLGSVGPGAVEAILAGIDGFITTTLDPKRDLVSVAAAPSAQPVVAATSGGHLVQWTPGQRWVGLGTGSDPAYPG
ncbi:MAG: hypothetical protein QOE01_1879 [Actinomycetota bacterium]|jgi:hypothetical protein|nr:hypothetical protein [Actinomycetota bacterium]